MKREKEVELIVLKHTKWLYFILALSFGLSFGVLIGYFMGVIDVSTIYQLKEVHETLNITKTYTGAIVTELK